MSEKPKRQPLWMEFMSDALMVCGLCGNSGEIDTRGHVFSPRGVPCGVKRFCICPNGRAAKRMVRELARKKARE